MERENNIREGILAEIHPNGKDIFWEEAWWKVVVHKNNGITKMNCIYTLDNSFHRVGSNDFLPTRTNIKIFD